MVNKQLQYNTLCEILPNISRRKGNQTIWSVNRIYILREIFSFKNYTEHETGRLVPDLFLLFKEALYEVIATGLKLSFNIFPLPSAWHTINTNCIKL